VDNFDISHSEKDFLGAAGGGKEAGGALSGDCHRNAVWMTLLLSMQMIANSHYQISYQSHAKDRHGNAARKP
jgi:hypothetical protein